MKHLREATFHSKLWVMSMNSNEGLEKCFSGIHVSPAYEICS
jgi:hypothetical protein